MAKILIVMVLLAGCAFSRTPNLLEEVENKYVAERLMASFEVKYIQMKYRVMNDYVKANLPGSYPAAVAGYVFLDLSIEGIGAAVRDPANISNLPTAFPDRVQPKSDEGKEYLAFLKTQMVKWGQNKIS